MDAPLATGKLPWNKEIHQDRNKRDWKYESKNTPPPAKNLQQ